MQNDKKMMQQFLDYLYEDNGDQPIRYAHLKKKPDGKLIPKYLFTKDKSDLLKWAGKTDRYMSIALRRDMKTNTGSGVAYSNVLFMDLDFHEYSETDALKVKAVKAIVNDYLLKQFSCIVDSGRGLHVYYKMPDKLYSNEFKTAQKRLIDYAFGVEFVKGCVDNNAKDISRILRLPGTINSKVDRVAKVLVLNDKVVDKDFTSMLKKDFSKVQAQKYSVIEAWKLCGLGDIPVFDENFNCPFPDHEDNSPSFKIFSESDTFWCFKCSSKGPKGKLNGIHFLELMGRPELIPQLKEISDVGAKLGYYMKEGGQLYHRSKKGDIFVCDFLSDVRIESETFLRRIFIDVGDNAIEITDIPNNSELKRRYLQAGKEFYLADSGSKLADILIQFIKLSDQSDKRIVFNPGLNSYTNGDLSYYVNGVVYPEVKREHIPVCDKIDQITDTGRFNVNDFIDNLIADNNYTHIIGMLWAIAATARDIFIKRKGLFPLFIATGVRESGKTMLGRLITSFFGYSRSEELDTTPFAMIKKLEAYGSLPIHFDEYGDKFKEKEHSELIKDISTSTVVKRERGTASQTTNQYYMQCPIIITGEKHIYDSGMVSRAIILNLGKNKHGNDDAFNEWSDDVIELRTLNFMHLFMKNKWMSFRNFIDKTKHSRKRDRVKKDIILQTLEYLEKSGMIEPGKISKSEISHIIEATDRYKEAISADIYSEILSDVFSVDYNPKHTKENDVYIHQMDQAIHFAIKDGVVFVNPTVLYQMYLDVSHGRQPMSRQSFNVAFHQAPDFLHVKDPRQRLYVVDYQTGEKQEKRNKAFMMSVSSYNREYIKVALMHKLQYNDKVADVYEASEKILDNMEARDVTGVQPNKGYEVI